MKCTNCRCVIPDRSDYCVYCGQAVDKGEEPTYPVGIDTSYRQRDMYAAPLCSNYDENWYYGISEENDGSDAYDTYYEADYYGGYLAGQNINGRMLRRTAGYNDSGIDISKLLVCFAGLDCIIILLLLLLILISLL